MKALELTVYPRHPQFGHYAVPLRVWSRIPNDDPDDFYEVTLSPDDVSQRIEEKRLTDAELAAEYHRAKWTGLLAEKHGGLSDEGRAKIRTVERFMQLPHYDELPL